MVNKKIVNLIYLDTITKEEFLTYRRYLELNNKQRTNIEPTSENKDKKELKTKENEALGVAQLHFNDCDWCEYIKMVYYSKECEEIK